MAKQNLLLVDADQRSLRVLEVSLRKAGYSVTTCGDVDTAVEMVELSRPDLIIADTRLGETDGFVLVELLQDDEEWREIPFMFLSSDGSLEAKVKGLELGIEDYLTKPIYIKEIITRVNLKLQRRQRQGLERKSVETKTRFSGSLDDMGLVDLLQTIDISRKSGVLYLTSDEGVRGAIYFNEGGLKHGEMGKLRGPAAVYRALVWNGGSFDLEFRPVRYDEETISTSTQGLLMEGMRRVDEWGRLLEALPPLDAVFEVEEGELRERLAEIPDEINDVLKYFDGRRSLMDVVDEVAEDDLETLAAISKLYFEGLIVDSGLRTSLMPEEEDTTGSQELDAEEFALAEAGVIPGEEGPVLPGADDAPLPESGSTSLGPAAAAGMLATDSEPPPPKRRKRERANTEPGIAAQGDQDAAPTAVDAPEANELPTEEPAAPIADVLEGDQVAAHERETLEDASAEEDAASAAASDGETGAQDGDRSADADADAEAPTDATHTASDAADDDTGTERTTQPDDVEGVAASANTDAEAPDDTAAASPSAEESEAPDEDASPTRAADSERPSNVIQFPSQGNAALALVPEPEEEAEPDTEPAAETAPAPDESETEIEASDDTHQAADTVESAGADAADAASSDEEDSERANTAQDDQAPEDSNRGTDDDRDDTDADSDDDHHDDDDDDDGHELNIEDDEDHDEHEREFFAAESYEAQRRTIISDLPPAPPPRQESALWRNAGILLIVGVVAAVASYQAMKKDPVEVGRAISIDTPEIPAMPHLSGGTMEPTPAAGPVAAAQAPASDESADGPDETAEPPEGEPVPPEGEPVPTDVDVDADALAVAEPDPTEADPAGEEPDVVDAVDAVDAVEPEPEAEPTPTYAELVAEATALRSSRRATPLWEQALEINPNGAEALEALAWAAINRGRNETARDLARRAVAVNPSSSRAWVTLGASLQELRDRDGAREAYSSCVEQGEGRYVRDCRSMLRRLR